MLDYRSVAIATVALDVGPNIVHRNPRPCWCGMRQEKPAMFSLQNEESNQKESMDMVDSSLDEI